MTIQSLIKPARLSEKSASSQKLLTGEELFNMGDMGRAELVKGELIHLMPTGFLHGIIETKITTALTLFVSRHKLGHVLGGETGLYTARNPDTVRGVDGAYISHERFAQLQSTSYLDVAPELVVEVMSPDDSWSKVNRKIEEYFGIGVRLIWIVDPQRRRVHVYTSPVKLEILHEGQILTGGEILPGFEIALNELFV